MKPEVYFYSKTINNQEISINLMDLSYIAKIQEESIVIEDEEKKLYIIETFYTSGRMAKIPLFETEYFRLISQHEEITNYIFNNTDSIQARNTSNLVAEEVAKIVEKSTDWSTELQNNFSENLLKIHQSFEDKFSDKAEKLMTQIEKRLENLSELERKLNNINNLVENFVGDIEQIDDVDVMKELNG